MRSLDVTLRRVLVLVAPLGIAGLCCEEDKVRTFIMPLANARLDGSIEASDEGGALSSATCQAVCGSELFRDVLSCRLLADAGAVECTSVAQSGVCSRG